jgi:hypothetical protein
VRARRIARAAALAWAALACPVLAALPAQARVDDGETSSTTHLGAWNVVLLFVAIPLGTLLLITLLTYAPSMRKRPRYRPSRVWDYDAVWFNGPDAPEKAIVSTPAIQMKGGGASASW